MCEFSLFVNYLFRGEISGRKNQQKKNWSKNHGTLSQRNATVCGVGTRFSIFLFKFFFFSLVSVFVFFFFIFYFYEISIISGHSAHSHLTPAWRTANSAADTVIGAASKSQHLVASLCVLYGFQGDGCATVSVGCGQLSNGQLLLLLLLNSGNGGVMIGRGLLRHDAMGGGTR